MKRTLLLSALALSLMCGCESKPQSAATAGKNDAHATDEHAHPEEGPHHGALVELGTEEYHAEVVHTTDSVTVYILDSHAKAAVPVDAPELVINVVHDGKPEQFKLAAAPEAGDGEGKTSRFTITDAELAAHIDDHDAHPKLSITIGGKPYRGDVPHDHDHDHPHAH